LVPQTLVAFWSAHWFRGSVPAGMTEQVPFEPARLHAMQVPLQALLQQTPCAQCEEVQSESAAQVAPGDFLPQVPPRQK
jgi:hypothetical protein